MCIYVCTCVYLCMCILRVHVYMSCMYVCIFVLTWRQPPLLSESHPLPFFPAGEPDLAARLVEE